MGAEEAAGAAHYDRVTQVWRDHVMGPDLHFGVFDGPATELEAATQALTDLLIERAEVRAEHQVLDVGCGVGHPAVRLARSRSCRVLGISTSPVGVHAAQDRARNAGLADQVEFRLADGMDSGLPAETFDRVFSLESAHMMPDLGALFSECFRVLRPGGRLALCDVCAVGSFDEMMVYLALGHSATVAERLRDVVHQVLGRTFGAADFVHLEGYREAARKAGFVEVAVEDISAPTRPTLEHWARNAHQHAEAIVSQLGERYLEDLLLSLLHMSLGWGRTGGYLVLTATRP